MPFDVLVNPSFTLADHLHVLGIRPIPMEQLDAYKAEQVRLHPKHFLLRRWTFAVTFAVYMVGSIYHAEPLKIVGAPWWAWLMVGFGCAGMALVMTTVTYMLVSMYLSSAGLKVKTQAFWREKTAFLPAVPQDIRAIARKIDANMIDATWQIGELIQDEIVIDPYLLVQYKGETACIGIWDIDANNWPKIVAIAETD